MQRLLLNPPIDDKFVTRQDFSLKVLTDNLSMQSNYFRHSLRVSLATLAGYIISMFLQLGHNYWILLTIIVILKPNYSLTKKTKFRKVVWHHCGGHCRVDNIIFYKRQNSAVLYYAGAYAGYLQPAAYQLYVERYFYDALCTVDLSTAV